MCLIEVIQVMPKKQSVFVLEVSCFSFNDVSRNTGASNVRDCYIRARASNTLSRRVLYISAINCSTRELVLRSLLFGQRVGLDRYRGCYCPTDVISELLRERKREKDFRGMLRLPAGRPAELRIQTGKPATKTTTSR